MKPYFLSLLLFLSTSIVKGQIIGYDNSKNKLYRLDTTWSAGTGISVYPEPFESTLHIDTLAFLGHLSDEYLNQVCYRRIPRERPKPCIQIFDTMTPLSNSERITLIKELGEILKITNSTSVPINKAAQEKLLQLIKEIPTNE